MTRRDLIQKVLLGGIVLLVLPSAVESCSKGNSTTDSGGGPSKIEIDLTNATYSVLNNTGGSLIVQGVIVANTPAGYVALDSFCTHQGCQIGYSSANNNFPCPCHGSVYSTTGSVVNGPAVTAVKSYSISKAGNTLTITL